MMIKRCNNLHIGIRFLQISFGLFAISFWAALSCILFPLSAFAVSNLDFVPNPELVDQPTSGSAIPVLCNSNWQQCAESSQLLGTINNNRGRWNPFLPENNMIRDDRTYYKEVKLAADGGRQGDGIYALRFVTNHDLRQTFKVDRQVDSMGKPELVTGDRADRGQNLMIKVDRDGVYKISFNPTTLEYNITPTPTYLTEIKSVQVNGFVWDDENMFQKFDETRKNHEMTQNGDWWEKTIPLKTNGGIDFRADGVYQFLFSANHNEDWGFGADNDGKGSLAGGTGFGSSGGKSNNSALTIQVFEDGDYTIRMNPQEYKFEVKASEGLPPVKILNDVTSFQLLGTIYPENQFDPTNRERNLKNIGNNVWTKTVKLDPGIYSANFAISKELFLDTMALGAWLESDAPNQLLGRAWHGKPNEPNIFFTVAQSGDYKFVYDANKDEFSIESLSNAPLEPATTIETLQLVGSFDEPMAAWQPTSKANNMQKTDSSIFVKDVQLEADRQYAYKYTANNWGWLWVFADYELDNYGQDFLGRNPHPANSTLEDLKKYGQLTTHGDPPTLEFTPKADGCYTFEANLETGAYSVQPSKNNTCN